MEDNTPSSSNQESEDPFGILTDDSRYTATSADHHEMDTGTGIDQDFDKLQYITMKSTSSDEDMQLETDKLIDFEGDYVTTSNEAAEVSNEIQPDWGPYNINNSTLIDANRQSEVSTTTTTTEEQLLPKENLSPPTVAEIAETKPEITEISREIESHSDSATAQPHVVDAVPGAQWLTNIDPRVVDLIYWNDPRKTGIVFGVMLAIVACMTFFSLITIVSYLSIAVLAITITYRGYRTIMQAIQKSGDQHPFKDYLDTDVAYSRETVERAVAKVEKSFNDIAKELRRLFLVEDLIDSLKFCLLLWLLTYIGEWFSGMTLVTLAIVSVFTVPKFYDVYRVPIDDYVGLVRTHVCKVTTMMQNKIPFLRKKAKVQ